MLVASCTSFMVGPDRDRANAIGGVSDAFRGALVNGYKGLGANQYAEADYRSSDIYYREYADAAACKPGLAVAAAPAPVAVGCADPNGMDQTGKLCQEGVVYFAWDRYDLLNPRETDRKQTVEAQAAALDLMVRQIQTIKPARIDVIGRADASGPEDYNYGLSECRARSVADALRARGLPAGIDIRTIPLGKTDLIVPTADGVRDPANRVVMVAYQTDRNAPPARQPAAAPKKDLFGCGTRHPYPPKS